MKSKIGLIICLFFVSSLLFAESDGERLFKENRPEEAVFYLENDISAGIASVNAYNYLGLCYYQLGQFDKSAEAFSKGLTVSGTNKKVLAFNQGNSFYALGKFDEAVKSYSLAFTADSTYYAALLNRANAYLMANQLQNAKEDYKKYLAFNPEDEQKESIVLMIAALETEIEKRAEEERIAAEEAARIAEEERKYAEEMERLRLEEEARIAEAKRIEEERIAEERRKEEERLAEEKRKEEERLAEERRKEEERIAEERRIEQERLAAEAERRRKLLEDVANSLHNTDSTNMSSGAEDLIEYDQEAELD